MGERWAESQVLGSVPGFATILILFAHLSHTSNMKGLDHVPFNVLPSPPLRGLSKFFQHKLLFRDICTYICV